MLDPPRCVTLVGASGAVPAAIGQFTVVARDAVGNRIAGAIIVIDLGGCLDLSICPDQLDPAVTVDCANKTVSKVADAEGSVTFIVLGGSNGAGHASTLLGGGRVFQNGTLVLSPTVCAYDLDGSGGVGAGDLSAWLGDFFTGQPYGRSDYDCSGNVGANDLSLWLGAFGSGAMGESCASRCP